MRHHGCHEKRHGSVRKYRDEGCRCEECVSAHLKRKELHPYKSQRKRFATPCVDCGANERLREVKAFGVVLCLGCHNKRRTGMKPLKVYEHGDYKKYNLEGCRCDLCRGAKREHNRKYY